MMTCSTSSIGTCASFEMTLNGNVARSSVARRNTASSSAIMQIFCRSEGRFCSRNGCAGQNIRHQVSPRYRSNLWIAVNGTHLARIHLWNDGLEFGDVARVERVQQVPDKVVFGPLERVQDRVHQLCAVNPDAPHVNCRTSFTREKRSGTT